MADRNGSILFSPHRPKAIIRLLDSSTFEVTLHSRLSVEDVLGLIAEKFEISNLDSRFFALSINDEVGNFHWLDSSLILKDLAAASANPHGNLILSHHVRFFVEGISEVQSASTAKFYFLEVQNQFIRHELICNFDDYHELAAILVALFAPDCQEETIREAISRVLINSHPSYILLKSDGEEVEKRIYERFLNCRRMPQGTAIMRFLKIAERSESYGYRMYELLNDDGDKCLVSIGSNGVYVYKRSRNMNVITPFMAFQWRYIDNLYYRENKFSIEIRPPKRDSKNEDNRIDDDTLVNDRQLFEAFSHPTTQVITTIRRNHQQQFRPLIYNFTCSSSLLCRTVWSSAIAQHQFFLDQKALKRVRPLLRLSHFVISTSTTHNGRYDNESS
ncbi:unnamed protein product [Caenorhabditis bovis]|uniref:FERM domain-containing protein n=1 Tax=Caenorhabditis bovis TaxID=2654633 RepID=A0A8S1F8N3_9PELO|nr:unnamed protein product [Caenorhabditis bovis]